MARWIRILLNRLRAALLVLLVLLARYPLGHGARSLLVRRAGVDGPSARYRAEPLMLPQLAATVFHDENGNGKFDRMFGYPLEGYGFTNNVYPTLRAPSLDQCEVQYAAASVRRDSNERVYVTRD